MRPIAFLLLLIVSVSAAQALDGSLTAVGSSSSLTFWAGQPRANVTLFDSDGAVVFQASILSSDGVFSVLAPRAQRAEVSISGDLARFQAAIAPRKGRSLFSGAPSAPRAFSKEAIAHDALAACEGTGGEKYTCYARFMENISYLFGQQPAFDVLDALQVLDKSAGGCHFIAHGIGWGLFRRDPSRYQEYIAKSPPGCTYGTQMGVIERYAASLPAGAISAQTVPDICGPNPPSKDCNHAVGHILLVETKNDLPAALDLCMPLPEGLQRGECFRGVFMERMLATNLVEHGIANTSLLEASDHLEENTQLCLNYSGDRGEACWHKLGHVVYYAFGENLSASDAHCARSGDAHYREICFFLTLGELHSRIGFDPLPMRRLCDDPYMRGAGLQQRCYEHVIGNTIQSINARSIRNLGAFCEGLADPSWCLGRVASQDGILSAQMRSQICQSASESFKSTCEGRIV